MASIRFLQNIVLSATKTVNEGGQLKNITTSQHFKTGDIYNVEFLSSEDGPMCTVRINDIGVVQLNTDVFRKMGGIKQTLPLPGCKHCNKP